MLVKLWVELCYRGGNLRDFDGLCGEVGLLGWVVSKWMGN